MSEQPQENQESVGLEARMNGVVFNFKEALEPQRAMFAFDLTAAKEGHTKSVAEFKKQGSKTSAGPLSVEGEAKLASDQFDILAQEKTLHAILTQLEALENSSLAQAGSFIENLRKQFEGNSGCLKFLDECIQDLVVAAANILETEEGLSEKMDRADPQIQRIDAAYEAIVNKLKGLASQ